MEILLLIGAVSSLLRSAFLGGNRIRGGPLLAQFLGLIAFIAWVCVNGVAQGGDTKIALQESRGFLYLFIAYLMSTNIISESGETRWITVRKLWWVMAWCIGLKGFLYTLRRYVTFAGKPLSDQGVGSHEEAFFFMAFVLLLLSLLLVGAAEHRRLRTVMLCLLPIVIIGYIATNRRAGTAALVVGAPILLMGAYRSMPEKTASDC